MDWLKKVFEIFGIAKNATTLQTRAVLFLWMILFGFMIAWVLIYYNRRIVGSFVRSILNSEAKSLEEGKTLVELNQTENVSAVEKYSKSSSLQGIVFSNAEVVDEGKHLLKIDESTKFYIPEEQQKRAQRMYDSVGNSGWMILLGVVAALIIGIGLSALLLM